MQKGISKLIKRIQQWVYFDYFNSLLAMIALSAIQSSAVTYIRNGILFIDTSNNPGYNQTHWLIGMLYLSIIASNDTIH